MPTFNQRPERTNDVDSAHTAQTRRASSPQRTGSHPLKALQQAVGNQTVQRLVRSGGDWRQTGSERPSGGTTPSDTASSAPAVKPSRRGDESASTATDVSSRGGLNSGRHPATGRVQAKLSIAEPDTPLEHEADAVADAIVGRATFDAEPRSCTSCSGLSRHPTTGDTTHTSQGTQSATSTVMNHVGPARPLDTSTRQFFESQLNYDFSQTRIHTGPQAHAVAQSISARAFTYGNSVAFARGEFDPRSTDGRHLLAHELTHVVQQASTASVEGLQRAPATPETDRQKEIERSKTSPGEVVGQFPPLSFSLYNFAIQESTLKTVHRDFLADLASWLSSSSAVITVSVAGHADNTGDASINEPLALNRGQAVIDFLVAQGVPVGTPTSFGATRPVAPNETAAGRARNRRVDLIVYIPESRPEPEPSETPEEVVPPGETLPPGEETDSTWFCTEHPWVCAALGAGTAAAVFCILFPEVCAAIGWPDWPDWPDWPWDDEDDEDDPDEEEEAEEEPDCGDPELPETHVEYIPSTGDKGNALEAKPLTRCPGNTTGSPAKNDDSDWPYGWTCVDVAGQGNRWVRAHLLHSDLHGPGDERRNIIISDKSINGLMYLRIEKGAIEDVWDEGKVLYYRVEVHHMTGPYPRPYFAEQVDMEYGEMDPITGVESPPLGTASITSNVGHQPPPCATIPEAEEDPESEPEPQAEPEDEPPQYAGPTIGPAPEGAVDQPTPVTADCGRISCLTMDHYRDSVGHFRSDVYIVTADEQIVREMIRLEVRFLKTTRFATEYRLLELDRIRNPQNYLARRFVLDTRVETAARQRVFDFLVNGSRDPTWSMNRRLSIEGWVRSDFARLRE